MKYLAICLGIQAANALLEIDTTHPNPVEDGYRTIEEIQCL